MKRPPDQTYVWGQDQLGEILLGTQKESPKPNEVERFTLRSVQNGVVLEVWLQPAYRQSPLIESLKAEEEGRGWRTAPWRDVRGAVGKVSPERLAEIDAAVIAEAAVLREAQASVALDQDPECGTRSVEAGDDPGIPSEPGREKWDGTFPSHETHPCSGSGCVDPRCNRPDSARAQGAEDPTALYHLLGGYLLEDELPAVKVIRSWTKFELEEVSRWARAKHTQAAPIAGHEYPPLPRIPACLELAIKERKAEAERLAAGGAEAKPKRTRKKRGSGG